MKQATGSIPRLIVAYLSAHPRAADSADGIRRWWLGPSGAAVRLDEVEQALATLVDQGQVRQVRIADGTLLYSRPECDRTASPNGARHGCT